MSGSRDKHDVILELTVGIIGFFSGIYNSWVDDPRAPIFVSFLRMNVIITIFSLILILVTVLWGDEEYPTSILVAFIFVGGLAAPYFLKSVKSTVEMTMMTTILLLICYNPEDDCLYSPSTFEHSNWLCLQIYGRLIVHVSSIRILFRFKRVLFQNIEYTLKTDCGFVYLMYIFAEFMGLLLLFILLLVSILEFILNMIGAFPLSIWLSMHFGILEQKYEENHMQVRIRVNNTTVRIPNSRMENTKIIQRVLCSKTCTCTQRTENNGRPLRDDNQDNSRLYQNILAICRRYDKEDVDNEGQRTEMIDTI